MARMQVPFALQKGDAGFTQNSRETLVNMYASVVNSGRSQIVRQQRPGLNRLISNTAEKRCIERFRNRYYAVIGTGFYQVTTGPALTLLGTLPSSSGRCTMIFNDNGDVMISDGEAAYYYASGVFGTTSLPTGVRVGTLAYLGGYGIFNNPDTGKFYITGLNDFTTVDDLDFATAESSPDNLVTIYADHGELWLFGQHSTEVWLLTGATDFPFTAMTNAVLERGCAAKLAVGAEDNTLYFLGEDLVVYRAAGYTPQRVSTIPVEDAISRVSSIARAAAYTMTYTLRGQKFITLTFPGELTLQFNIATGLWNKAETHLYRAWNVIGSLNTQSDYFLTPTGLCSLDPDLSTDEGGVMRCGGVSAPGWNDGDYITVGSIWLDAEVGRVPANGDARVMMRFAPDGETFGNERWRTLGTTGDYRHKPIWRQLGRGRKPVVEFWKTDPVPLKINNIICDVS